MKDFILFLDEHSGSLTFIVTAVYVVATIVICYANIKSARAAKLQLTEMQKQFYTVNRPNVTVEMIYERKCFYGLRFTNIGNQTAYNVSINLSEKFLNSLPQGPFRELLIKNNDKVCIIGVGQHYDLYFATNDYLRQEKKAPITGRVTYNGVNSSIYAEDFQIDAQNYATFFSINTEIDDIMKKMDEQTSAIKGQNMELRVINNTLERYLNTDESEQNNV